MAIQEYFRTSICLDVEQVQNGHPNLPGLKKLTMAICKNLYRYSYQSTEYIIYTTMYRADLTMLWPFLWDSEISHILPALEVFHRALDQQLSPGIGQVTKQVGGTLNRLQNDQPT